MADKTGGPAYPSGSAKRQSDFVIIAESEPLHTGMTLRDYFAIEALKGVGDWTPWPSGVVSLQQNDPRIDLRESEAMRARAEWAYRQADAMLEERNK